ncbi:MAG: PPOX class F420-dependent oxidoreductase [Acidimicrobiales bacterium]|nr:PPOX class F420-dependent oxidoreductase [Acidimicrobiales bacterium]
MALDPSDLSDDVLTFLSEYHLATLTTSRPDGSPHVVPVGFSYDQQTQLARIITWAQSRKARNVAESPLARVVLCQVDGGRWLSLEGNAVLSSDTDRVATAVKRYAQRYRQPGEREDRVVIEVSVDRILGHG